MKGHDYTYDYTQYPGKLYTQISSVHAYKNGGKTKNRNKKEKVILLPDYDEFLVSFFDHILILINKDFVIIIKKNFLILGLV